jgi:hypothetical protein
MFMKWPLEFIPAHPSTLSGIVSIGDEISTYSEKTARLVANSLTVFDMELWLWPSND